MDFSNNNIQEILKYSVPKRFQDMSPTDFEDFIAHLFKKLGYQVEQTSYSGDFGADLLVTKLNKKFAVQVKRYAKTNKVGVKDINQVIGSKEYYKCDASMIVTTSGYTNPALKLINEANVECWNWNDLQINISNAYLNGQDIYQFFPNLLSISDKATLQFEITKIVYNVAMKRIGNCTLVFAKISNSGANTNIALQLPVIITKTNQQVEAIYWYEGYFSSGTVYSGASVDVAFMFRSDQLKIVSAGDRIIFNVYQDSDDVETFETTVNIASGCLTTFLLLVVPSISIAYFIVH